MAATIYLEISSDRYGILRKDLSNDFLKSTNNYPMDLVAAQTLLLKTTRELKLSQSQSNRRPWPHLCLLNKQEIRPQLQPATNKRIYRK